MSIRSEELLENIGHKLDELISVSGNSPHADGFYEEMEKIQKYLKSIDVRLNEIQTKVELIESNVS